MYMARQILSSTNVLRRHYRPGGRVGGGPGGGPGGNIREGGSSAATDSLGERRPGSGGDSRGGDGVRDFWRLLAGGEGV